MCVYRGANKKSLVMTPPRTFAGDEAGACAEFEHVEYPFKWRKYVCARCGMHRIEHRESKAKAADDTAIREEHLPQRKRLMIRYKRSQALAAAAAAKEKEKGKEKEKEKEKEEGLEEGEIWTADVVTKRKRTTRRKRADAL